MNLYKQAVRENWTFPSPQGMLSVVQLADLPLTSHLKNKATLDSVAVALYEETNSKPKVSFVNRSVTDSTASMKLELVKDLIATKEAENQEKLNEKANLAHNAMLDELIANKKAQELANKSVEELMAMKR